MSRRRSTYVARRRTLGMDGIEVGLFIAASLLASVIAAAAILAVAAGYMR